MTFRSTDKSEALAPDPQPRSAAAGSAPEGSDQLFTTGAWLGGEQLPGNVATGTRADREEADYGRGAVESSLLPEMIDFGRLAGEEAVKIGMAALVRSVFSGKKGKDDKSDEIVRLITEATQRDAFGLHLTDACRWAQEIQVQGMGAPVATSSASVPLEFGRVARRFRSPSDQSRPLDEDSLFGSDNNILLLGDPGAGKTTTIKRLTLKLFTPPEPGDSLTFPLVIRCREVEWMDTDLASEILRRVGAGAAIPIIESRLESVDLVDAAAMVLDRLGAFLLVDGLDEISDGTRQGAVLDALLRLSRRLSTARIVCSSRSGEAPHLEGFLVADLLPLSEDQVAEIIERRTRYGDEFLAAVSLAGIGDLLDRPLFLNQLLLVFETTGSLPDRPVDLYRQLVRLLLHEWDEQRRVTRRSAYANFDSSAKQDFLSELAFALTERGRVTFSHEELVQVYQLISDKTGLPKSQAIRVAREVESHNGIIAETANGFQFTHLTLQEYLCAENIVRQGMNDDVANYLRRYPEAVAVAVALSTRPSDWLVQCVRRARSFDPPHLVDTFVRRLGLERPRFIASTELGEVVLKLATQTLDIASWEKFADLEPIRTSVSMVHDKYYFDTFGNSVKYTVKRADGTRLRLERGRMPLALYELLTHA